MPDLVEEYTQMVSEIVHKYYLGVSRYTTSAFLRIKLGDAWKNGVLPPHLREQGRGSPGTAVEESGLEAVS